MDTILKSAKERGLDFSTTIDGKGIKFLHFGDVAGLQKFYNDVREMGLTAGLSDFTDTTIRSNLNEAETYLKGSSESSSTEGGPDHQIFSEGPSITFLHRTSDSLKGKATNSQSQNLRTSSDIPQKKQD